MKSHYWVGHQRVGDTIEITIKDVYGKKLERWELNLADKKAVSKLFRILRQSYGFELTPESENRDLDWLRREG